MLSFPMHCKKIPYRSHLTENEIYLFDVLILYFSSCHGLQGEWKLFALNGQKAKKLACFRSIYFSKF